MFDHRKPGFAHSQPTLVQSSVTRQPPLPSHRAQFKRYLDGRGWVTGVAALVGLVSLLPLGFILWVAVQSGWTTVAAMVLRPRVGELLVNTVSLVLLTVPITGALAIGLAWLTERSDLPGARFWAGLLVAPLAVPAFVHSYAWITVIPSLHGLPAALLIATLAYFPFVYLPVAAMLRRLDPTLEDLAASLGLSPFRVFRRMVLPQLRLAILGGALLVSLHLLAEYGLFVFIRFDTFTTAIVDQFQSSFNGPAANLMGGVLVICCLGLLGLEFGLRGDARYSRVGAGAARMPDRVALGRATLPCLALLSVVVILSVGVPCLTLIRWLVAGGFSVWADNAILTALAQTFGLGLTGGLLTVVLAIPFAWISIRRPDPLSKGLEASQYIIGALPGVVVALALVTVTVRVALPLYQTLFTILLAYGLMFLPRALISLRASIAQTPVELEQAATGLGRTPFQAVTQVTMRLAAPGAAAGMALAALGIMTELTATQMLAPNGVRTLAMAFWAKSSELDYAAAAPYAVIMVLLSLPLTVVLFRQSRRMAGR